MNRNWMRKLEVSDYFHKSTNRETNICTSTSSENQFFFDWDLDGKIRPVGTEKIEIEYGDESKLLAHLDLPDNQKSEARIRDIYYLPETHCKSFKLLIVTPLGVIRLIVTQKYENENWQKSRNWKKDFEFWEFQDFGAKNQMTENWPGSF